MDVKVKISSLLIALVLATTVKAQCTLNSAELQNHMLSGKVFLTDATVTMREVAGIHRLIVQWELAHPACMDRICVLFPSGGISQYCVSSTLSTEASIPDLPCNQNVDVRVEISGGSILISSSTLTIYIGGNANSPPSAPPRSIFARKIRFDPHRIEMGWEPMACLKQNSPITNYLVEYGRTNTTELRTAITSDTYIFSVTFNANKGLGFLHFGEEYWFRVTARNTNGQGPFSVTLRATPLALLSDPPPPPPTTTPPPSTAPPTTSSPPPPITTSQSPPPSVTTITTPPATTIKAPVTFTETQPKLTTTMRPTQKPSTPITDQPTQGSISSSTPKPAIEKDKTTMLPKDTVSKGEDKPTTLPNSNKEDHSKTPAKPTEVAKLNPSTGGSKTVIIVCALLVFIVLIVTATAALVAWMLCIHNEARLLLNAGTPSVVDTSGDSSLTCTPNCAYSSRMQNVEAANAQIQTRNPISSSRQISVQYDYPELRFTAGHSNESMELSDTYDVIATITRNK